MKTIENPSGRKVGLLLIPAFLMLVAIPILKSIPVWVIVTSALSFASYLGVLTYYCVRQKCYRQLTVNCIVIVLWVVIFVVQFGVCLIPLEMERLTLM